MSFDKCYLDFMPQTVTWEAYSALSTDGFGSKTYSTGVSVKARIQQKRTIAVDLQGREVRSDTQVYLPPWSTAGTSSSVTIGPYDRLTLPSGFLVAGSSAPPIISVERYQDDAGDHGFRVYL